MKRLVMFFMTIFFIVINVWSQETIWKIQWKHPQAFIRNDGQFDGFNKMPERKILYGIDHGNVRVFFTKKGLLFASTIGIKTHIV